MKTKSIILLMSLSFCNILLGQNKNTIGIWHKYTGDSLKIRWIPAEATKWEQYNLKGYSIERAIVKQGKPGRFIKLNQEAILPLTEEGFTSEETEILARQVMYNKNIESDFIKKAGQDAADKLNLRHYFAILTAFKSYPTAIKMGLGFTDHNIKKGEIYTYKIYSNSNIKSDTIQFVFNSLAKSNHKMPPRLEAEEIEKAVFLKWPAKQYQKYFAMYHIERSRDGKIFEKITSLPVAYSNSKVDIEFHKDSVGVNYEPHIYRLMAMDFFGEWYTSTFLTVAQGKDKTPPSPPKIESKRFVNKNTIELKWSMPILEADLKGFYISSRKGLKGIETKSKFINKNVFVYNEEKKDRSEDETFLVYAVDTAGNEKASLPIYIMAIDTIPPTAPKNILAIVDTLGHVAIKWDKSPDQDTKGYYVYFANQLDHEFSQITNNMLTETSFKDTITLRSLTKKVFYKIVAVDEHFNHSTFSEPIALKRPDIIKPIAPSIDKIEIKNEAIVLSWHPSPSNDVVEYQVLRRTLGAEYQVIRTIARGDIKSLIHTDTKIEKGKKYEYCLVVIDDSGLISKPSNTRVKSVQASPYLTKAPELKADFNKELLENKVTWNYNTTEDFKVAIYRIEKKEGYKLIGFCDAKTHSFSDKVAGKNKFKYTARAILADGRQSVWAEEIGVN